MAQGLPRQLHPAQRRLADLAVGSVGLVPLQQLLLAQARPCRLQPVIQNQPGFACTDDATDNGDVGGRGGGGAQMPFSGA